jgi:hypothetical protein
MREAATAELDVHAWYADFDDLWSPLETGVGPAGAYLASQPPDRQAAMREACHAILGKPEGEFSLRARVLAIRGRT